MDIAIFRIVALRWYEEYIDLLDENNFDPNYCDQPDETRYKIIAFQASCVGYCLTQYPISDPSIEMLITKKSCTEDYCCRWIQSFCVDRLTGAIQVGEERESDLVGECTNMMPPLTECPPGQNVTVTDCIDSCTE